MSDSNQIISDSAVKHLPLVVQVGFAGARQLFDAHLHPEVDAVHFEDEVTKELEALMRSLPQRLGCDLEPVFFCGISQIAIGADTAFTRACEATNTVQRIFLPQHLDKYLTATGSTGPDFTDDERANAERLLSNPNIVQQRVVSHSPDRHERFRETNIEIARVSDVLICLVRADQVSKAGGTHEMIQLAENRNRPLCVLTVSVGDQGEPIITTDWPRGEQFECPRMPKDLTNASLETEFSNELPNVQCYCKALKQLGSDQARWQQRFFKNVTFVIIGAHILATVLAVIALKLHNDLVPWLLGFELVLLAIGLATHEYLHHSQSVKRWALFRLVAEVSRSLTAIGSFHIYLEHLFTLPFPFELRPLLRTINVLHLRSTVKNDRSHRKDDRDHWKTDRERYVTYRLTAEDSHGQIAYNRRTVSTAHRQINRARWTFLTASAFAFAATSVKLLALCHCLPLDHDQSEQTGSLMGFFAILLPVIAVAALSLAGAFDLEAKFHIAKDQIKFLEEQCTLLEHASSEREFSQLLLETESRLLGETVNWYHRRSFLMIA